MLTLPTYFSLKRFTFSHYSYLSAAWHIRSFISYGSILEPKQLTHKNLSSSKNPELSFSQPPTKQISSTILSRKMKKMDHIFCTSTAICLSMEQKQPSISPSPSSSSSSSLLLGRALDRHNPIIHDSRRIPKSLPPCSISQPPVSSKPIKNQIKKKNTKNPPKENDDQTEILNGFTAKRTYGKVSNDDIGNGNTKAAAVLARKSWNCTRPGDFISPPGSTRYLLNDKAVLTPDFGPGSKQFPAQISKSEVLKTEEPSSSPEQVVVLRVSLHCRGCEKKMRKHISRMEGVTYFDIDFPEKKVTVVGNVTPLGVLSSISKVKNAQLWPPTIPSSIPQLYLSGSELKKGYKVAGE